MAITIHLALLGAVLILTSACLATRGGRANRPLLKVLLAALPPWLLGCTSILVMSADGVPTIEWILPTIAILLLGIWCRDDRLFANACLALRLAALVLFINFFFVVESGYTRSGRLAEAAAASQKRSVLKALTRELRVQHSADEDLPAGPVADLLPGNNVTQVVSVSPDSE